MSLCVGLLRAFGAAMFSNQGVVFRRGLSECWLACVFVFVCVVARFVLVLVPCGLECVCVC